MDLDDDELEWSEQYANEFVERSMSASSSLGDSSLQHEGGGIKAKAAPKEAEAAAADKPKTKANNDQNKQRFIVDRDITDNAIEGIFITIQDAIDAASQSYQNQNNRNSEPSKIKIKIASNLYEESLYINVPGLVLEPKEKGGEVTLQRDL